MQKYPSPHGAGLAINSARAVSLDWNGASVQSAGNENDKETPSLNNANRLFKENRWNHHNPDIETFLLNSDITAPYVQNFTLADETVRVP